MGLIAVQSYAKKLVFYGNSLFHLSEGNVFYGFGVSRYVRTNMSPRPPVEDYSYQGKNTQQLISEFPTVVAPYIHPNDVVVIWEGVNDIAATNGNQTPAQALTNLKSLSTLIHAKGCKCVLLTCVPIDNTYVVDADRLSLNSLILADTSFWDNVIDMTTETIFDTYTDVNNSTYYETDKRHHKTVAQAIVGARIVTIIQPYFN